MTKWLWVRELALYILRAELRHFADEALRVENAELRVFVKETNSAMSSDGGMTKAECLKAQSVAQYLIEKYGMDAR